jgi:hypothetical protein
MEVQISIWSTVNSICVYANSETSEFIINNETINEPPEKFIIKTKKITEGWKSNTQTDLLDGTKFIIGFTDDNKSKIIYGADNLPQNFKELLSLIDDFSTQNKQRLIEKEKFLLLTKFKKETI